MRIKTIPHKIFILGIILLTGIKAKGQYHILEQTETIKVPGITADTSIYNLTAVQKATTRVYYDGLGRPVQSVLVKGSPSQKDIVQVMIYDNLGRQTTGYLPYAGSDGNGMYRPNALTEQSTFYNNGLADKVADDSMPFSKQVIESSPLQRLLQAGSVGTGFQPGEHYSSMNYRSNNTTADGSIILWLPDGTRSGTYSDNLLSVTEATNADGNKALVFTDKAGRTILKRQMLDATHQNDTYYIYNNAGAISYVLPPKATKLLTDNPTYTLTTTGVSALIYKYVYDDKGRLKSKTIPGAGDLYVIYDPLDRPVLMQDANLRFTNKWNFIKYDVQGRAVLQGYYTDATNLTPAAMQTYVDGMATAYASTWYEGRSTVLANGYYTNGVFPTTGTTILACSYYDDYDLNYDASHAPDYSYTAQGLTKEATATNFTRGMLTMTRMRRVGSGLGDTWFTKVMFYDKRGNVIQVQSNNQLVSTTLSDVATSVPDFTGATLQTKVQKFHAASTSTTVLSTYSYDHMLRITAVKQKYNTDTEKTVASYEYNELGQLIDKKLGVNGAAFLQSVDYRYNIRGQLLSINNSKLIADATTYTNDDTNDVFGEELSYNISNTQVGSTGTWSGQLTAVKWMSLDGANTKSNERSYKYTYDGLNRFTQALYAERSSTATPTTNFTLNAGGFDEKGITYDENGNIQALQRYSSTVGGSGSTKIDGLKYTYDTNNLNKLLMVTDSTANNSGFRNYMNNTTNSYSYDAAGNLTADPYKGITQILYNVLNRVDKVTLTYPSPATTGRYLDYTYDATGKLIRKRQYDNNVLQNTTDYIDGFVYLNGTLSYFGMPEGRVRNTGSSLKAEYIITDHQGNARVSFEDSGTGTAKVVQENSYYAYGMSMTSTMSLPTQPNKQLYNGGSEWQNDFSDQPDWQQTFYRNYDQTIGRFLAVDPMAEATAELSVYQYANNNPVMFNDPLGNLSKADIESFGPLKYADGLSGSFWKKTYGSEQEWAYAMIYFAAHGMGGYGNQFGAQTGYSRKSANAGDTGVHYTYDSGNVTAMPNGLNENSSSEVNHEYQMLDDGLGGQMRIDHVSETQLIYIDAALFNGNTFSSSAIGNNASDRINLFGQTVTNQVGSKWEWSSNLGDKVSYKNYTLQKSGVKGIIQSNITTFNGKFSSIDYSLNLGPLSLAYDATDLGISVGLQAGGSKSKVGASFISGISLSIEGTNPSGVISGFKSAFRPGGYSFIAAGVIIFAPEFIPAIARLIPSL
jgi:RHS repeat-associated protein